MDRVRYLIGLITLLLAAAGGIYLFNLLGEEDKSLFFRLQVEFQSVEGLLPGADIKYRGVQVGSVRSVELRDDGRRGLAVVVLRPGVETLACTNTRFWIVTPRFGGLASGASGLETLVRDAYVSFLTPEPRGPHLANGSTVIGSETPFEDDSEASLPPPRGGDLSMTLLIPENHGLGSGSEVRFRGVRTGEVRRVDLTPDGDHVVVAIRIDRRYRQTVTDKTRFWVARPRVSGTVLQGLSIEDVSALLIPFVGYHTEPGQGLPVPDQYVVAAEVDRPEIGLAKVAVPDGAEGTPAPPPDTGGAASIELVRVLYEAIEDDVLSADDEVRREGTGVLFVDREGQLRVLTARSLTDAAWFERDTFGGDPEILSEHCSIVLGDGTVMRARRTWVGENGEDLALLAADLDHDVREEHEVAWTSAALFAFEEAPAGPGTVRMLGPERRVAEQPLPDDGALPDLATHRGAAVLRDGRIVGVLGQSGGTDPEPAVAPVQAVPPALRPRP